MSTDTHPRSLEFCERELAYAQDLNVLVTRMLGAGPIPTAFNIPEDEVTPETEAAATMLLACLMALTRGNIEDVRGIWPAVARGHISTFQEIAEATRG